MGESRAEEENHAGPQNIAMQRNDVDVLLGHPTYEYVPDAERVVLARRDPDPARGAPSGGLRMSVSLYSDCLDVTIALAPKQLAELHEAKGDRARAAGYYQRFVDLWKNADPTLQPHVADVRRRLARLSDAAEKR